MVLYNALFFPMQLYKTIVTTNVGSLWKWVHGITQSISTMASKNSPRVS